MRHVFTDPDTERRFQHDGYITVDGLDEAQVARFRNYFAEVRPGHITQMYSNVHDLPIEVNQRVGAMLDDAFGPILDRLTHDYVLKGGTFLIKGRGDDSVCNVHQDWCTVDESRFVGLGLWVPLVDVDRSNGCLVVAPGSHHYDLFPTLRGANFENAHLEFGDDILPYLIDVPLRAGQICLFAQNLFHGSWPNGSADVRECLYAGAIPRETHMIHYHEAGPERYVVLDIDEQFYYTRTAGSLMNGLIPDNLTIRGEVTARRGQVTRDEFVAAMRRIQQERETLRAS